MKIFVENEKGRAVCHRDGVTTTTYLYRDVPFSDGSGVVKNILVGVCDKCADVIAVPPQSTPAIGATRSRVEHALEVNIPAPFIEILDAAGYRVDARVTPDFRKRLLMFYINRYARGVERPAELSR